MELVWLAVGALVGAAVVWRMRRGPAEPAATVSPAPAADAPDGAETPHERLQRLRRAVESQDERIQRPADLLDIPEFREAVDLLAGDGFAAPELVRQLTAPGYVLACMSAAAMARRSDVVPADAVNAVPQLGAYSLGFVLDYLRQAGVPSALPSVAVHAREWWWDYLGFREKFQDFVAWAAPGLPSLERPAVLDAIEEAPLQEAHAVLARFREPALEPVLRFVDDALAQRRQARVLGEIGRTGAQPDARRFAYPALVRRLEHLHELVAGEHGRSTLVVGEHGVGKTVLLDMLCARLQTDGWLVFEASAMDVLAGQKYIGELEGRMRDLLAVLRRGRTLWRVPDFFDLLHKGSHSSDPRGILDLVLPAISRGELRLAGEIGPRQFAQLTLARPAVRQGVASFQVPAADTEETAELALLWAQAARESSGRPVIGAPVLAESARIAAQYFPEQHEPGRSLRLLDDALQSALREDPPGLPLDNDSLLAAVARRSGLPLDVIDERRSLDLERLRGFFRQRVVGQDEAVDALLDRIAMLKAGLTDAQRPIGVFLFAGPTGTGKTELAKALGELLFGDAERLLRLDMSEYQAPDAAQRLLETQSGEGGARSLVARIREQPFSVVLLDEFEKAHPNVWDLFLQVFDDGRLSDVRGNTVDFRHSIVILTSNAGSTLSRDSGPGFLASAGGYSRSAVEKALFQTFRREFLNRIDRIVLFRPLDRGLMRGILHKELERALGRRGLRNRAWAVEWEPSAIEFLLDRGFTPDLGARPLRRAIEHHLLAPLARSIVEHRTPEGDQFLFVRSAGDRLEVEFIDPDPAPATPAEGTADPAPAADDDLRDLVQAPSTGPETVARLDARLEALEEDMLGPQWRTGREADYGRMGAPGFWDSPERHAVLDRIERRDRIESALDTALRMHRRLGRDGGNASFVGSLAQLLFLLGLATDALRADRAQDALLEIDASESAQQRHGEDLRLWWRRVRDMYLAWAQRRNMRVEILRDDPERCSAWLAVGGFGALDLLQPEAGLHVYEDATEDATHRLSVLVRVAADLPGQDRRPQAAADSEKRICRRYRQAPSPLVRDGVRGWRSGRFDRIMQGEFDVIQGG